MAINLFDCAVSLLLLYFGFLCRKPSYLSLIPLALLVVPYLIDAQFTIDYVIAESYRGIARKIYLLLTVLGTSAGSVYLACYMISLGMYTTLRIIGIALGVLYGITVISAALPLLIKILPAQELLSSQSYPVFKWMYDYLQNRDSL